MSSSYIRYSYAQLEKFCLDCFGKFGFSDEESRIISDVLLLSDLYGIDSSLVKQAASYVTIEGAFPDEIVIVEAVSEKDAETIAILLENRLSEVKEQSKSYDPENYALAQQCTVGRKGCFVSMFLAPEHAKMNEIFNRYVK